MSLFRFSQSRPPLCWLPPICRESLWYRTTLPGARCTTITAMAGNYAHSNKLPRGGLNTDLNWICQKWHLQSATTYIPRFLAPDGEAEIWPRQLLRQIAELAMVSKAKRNPAVRDILEVCRLRLRRFPESDPNLLPQDVRPVLSRHNHLREWEKTDRLYNEYKCKLPKLNVISLPPKWKKREWEAGGQDPKDIRDGSLFAAPEVINGKRVRVTSIPASRTSHRIESQKFPSNTTLQPTTLFTSNLSFNVLIG
jgi:hypothetical protein